ncbi:unnamed protein product [Lampetra planeri]
MTGRKLFNGKNRSWSKASTSVPYHEQKLAHWEPPEHHKNGLKGAALLWEKKMATGLPHGGAAGGSPDFSAGILRAAQCNPSEAQPPGSVALARQTHQTPAALEMEINYLHRVLPWSKEALLQSFKDYMRSILDNFTEIVKTVKGRE